MRQCGTHCGILGAAFAKGAGQLTELPESSEARTLILSVPACEGDAVYTAAFSNLPQDHAMHLTVATATSWEFGVWAD